MNSRFPNPKFTSGDRVVNTPRNYWGNTVKTIDKHLGYRTRNHEGFKLEKAIPMYLTSSGDDILENQYEIASLDDCTKGKEYEIRMIKYNIERSTCPVNTQLLERALYDKLSN